MTINEIIKTLFSNIKRSDYPPPIRVQNGLIRFTAKERKQMPKGLRKHFRIVDTLLYKKYINEDGPVTYEINCRIDGQKIVARANTLAEAKHAFIQELNAFAASIHKRA